LANNIQQKDPLPLTESTRRKTKVSKRVLLWSVAFLFTVVMAYYQRTTGPSYPIHGKATIGETIFKYSLTRTHGGPGDQPVTLDVSDESVTGTLYWRYYKLDEPFRALLMQRNDGALSAMLPHQPPAGKLEYYVTLQRGSESIHLPPSESVVTRFKGDVPTLLLVFHILCMFCGLLVAAYAALSALANRHARHHIIATLIFTTIGGLILGPFVQKYAFGAYWTGWPFGTDWTDNKTAIMVLVWVIALWRIRGPEGERKARWWIVAAMLVMFAVYMIPHSTRGSEINYRSLPVDSLRVTNGDISPASPDMNENYLKDNQSKPNNK
jgi:hypothetical protein